MPEELHSVMRAVHIALGGAGFLLGALAALLPKFGPRAGLHRVVGRIYGVSMLGMGALSIPLAANQNNFFLLVIGMLTLGWVAAGWIAIRRARLASAPREAAAIDRPAHQHDGFVVHRCLDGLFGQCETAGRGWLDVLALRLRPVADRLAADRPLHPATGAPRRVPRLSVQSTCRNAAMASAIAPASLPR